MARIDAHRLAEERSLALHGVIAARIRREPEIIAAARARVATWLETGAVAMPYAQAWQDILARSTDEIAEMLTNGSEHARALRQVTPFAGVVDPRARWRIWRDVRERLERSAKQPIP